MSKSIHSGGESINYTALYVRIIRWDYWRLAVAIDCGSQLLYCITTSWKQLLRSMRAEVPCIPLNFLATPLLPPNSPQSVFPTVIIVFFFLFDHYIFLMEQGGEPIEHNFDGILLDSHVSTVQVITGSTYDFPISRYSWSNLLLNTYVLFGKWVFLWESLFGKAFGSLEKLHEVRRRRNVWLQNLT